MAQPCFGGGGGTHTRRSADNNSVPGELIIVLKLCRVGEKKDGHFYGVKVALSLCRGVCVCAYVYV